MPVICITGGSKGIGRAIAKRFYDAGWQVAICARGEKGLEAAQAEMPNITTDICDMSDGEAVQALGQAWLERYGHIDVLINNAGVFLQGELLTSSDADFDNMMKTNLYSAYYMSRSVAGKMKEARKGSIVNICSVASLKAYPAGGGYGVSKYAMLGLSHNLREELKPHGVRVISIMPGAVYTASWEGVEVEEDRLMPPEDIAELVWLSTQLSNRSVVEDVTIRPQLGDL